MEIITPNPGSSGSARVEHPRRLRRSVIANGGTEEDGEAYLTKFFENAVALPGSARDATDRVHQRHRRRADLLRERGDPGPAERRRRSTTSSPTRHAADREPRRGHRRTPRRAARRSWTSCSPTRPRPTSPSTASARSSTASSVEVEGANDPADPFPTPEDAAHRRRGLRRLGRGQRRSSSTRRAGIVTDASRRRPARPATSDHDRSLRRPAGGPARRARRRRGPSGAAATHRAPSALGLGVAHDCGSACSC